MPSLTSTLTTTFSLASLALTAPLTTRQSVPPAPPAGSFYITATSVYTPQKYTSLPLSGCHTAAGQESFCAINGTLPGSGSAGLFTLNSTTSNIEYYLTVNGGSSSEEYMAQPLSFVQNSSYPSLEYGFFNFGANGAVQQFEIDGSEGESNGVIGVVQEGKEPLTTFYLCPEYVDYDHEGYETVSLISDYQSVPSDSGCNTVTLRKLALAA